MSQAKKVEFGDNVDEATFEQILDMDEDEDDREFSKSIVFDFLEQAEKVFQQMDDFVSVLTTLFPRPALPSAATLTISSQEGQGFGSVVESGSFPQRFISHSRIRSYKGCLRKDPAPWSQQR